MHKKKVPLHPTNIKHIGLKETYFTSNKSSILELCCWMGNHPNIGNPFNNAKKEEFNARMNYNSTYTDIMLYKQEFI